VSKRFKYRLQYRPMTTPNFKKINDVIALVSTLALVIFTASIISKVIWQVLEKDNSFPASKTLDINTTETSVNLRLPSDLFGSLTSTEPAKYSKIEKTRLNLVLVGILAKQENPSVIIKQQGDKENIYQINDFITPTTILKEVFSDYVVLERNGNLEKLEIIRKGLEESNTNNAPSYEISNSNKSKLSQYLKDLNNKPENLFNVLSVEPNYSNGELRGFIISPGTEKALFEGLGFQKNDIILNINNNELTNLSQAFKLKNVLVEQKLFNFKVERKGQIKFLTINLN
jgi:general secretion pathway protein C